MSSMIAPSARPVSVSLPPKTSSVDGELLISSGFGGSTRLTTAAGPYFHGAPEQYQDIVGTDNGPRGIAWDKISQHPNLGDFRIYYEGGDASQRSASIVHDETNPTRQIFRFQISEPNVVINWQSGPEHKARIQAELYGNNGLREIYQTVRLRLGSGMQALEQFPKAFHWFTLFEFWNQPFWNDYPFPFRVSIALSKASAAPSSGLYFTAEAQKKLTEQTFSSIWSHQDSTFKVPFSTWMDLEIYYREGDAEHGRLFLAVTPENGPRHVVINVTGATVHPDNPSPAGLTHYNPMKLYTSAELVKFLKSRGQIAQLDWDDLQLWKDRRPIDVAKNVDSRFFGSQSPAQIVKGGCV